MAEDTCPITETELLESNLPIPMLTTLLNRYEYQQSEQEAYLNFLNDLNDTIQNITSEKRESRAISKFFKCNSFADFLTKKLKDLEFKRGDKNLF